jgi:hypothetical protein
MHIPLTPNAWMDPRMNLLMGQIFGTNSTVLAESPSACLTSAGLRLTPQLSPRPRWQNLAIWRDLEANGYGQRCATPTPRP